MPWVRLHGVKDYLDMALILEEFPEMRLTINLVPSLVEQIEEFARGEAADAWLRLAERPAAELGDDEKVLLLDRFFMANFDTMIAPHRRYRELHRRRGWSPGAGELNRRARSFSEEDWRDLQVWFHLAWTDPLLIARDKDLEGLVKKGRGFGEEEKHLLLAKHRAILADIVPTHRRLQESGQLEVTTSPHFHPILPLLCDTDWARQARPKIALPSRRFRHPEDAEAQVRSALDFMAQRLGAPPRGMWPSEGSVCEELVPILARAGVEWIASDEEVLAHSLDIAPLRRDPRGRTRRMDALYRPHAVEFEGHRLNMVFRDHALSDFIGFHAVAFEPEEAADSLLQHLHDIERAVRDNAEPHLVTIILDGENCWEFHPSDGLPFLRALYGGLCEDPSLRPVRVGDFLADHPPRRTLARLHAGSWINHDFSIWIGHEEDNRAWDLLSQTRDRVMERIEQDRASLTQEQIDLAHRAIFIAEGSDWNWWYGDDHSSGMDGAFDDLYRAHLAAAHRAVGLEPPPELQIPIVSEGDVGMHSPPRGYLEITVDGRDTHFFEWAAAGHCDPVHGGGAMHRSELVITALRYGFTRTHLALRLDLASSIWERVGEAQVSVEFLIHEPARWVISAALPPGGGKGPVCLSMRPLGDEGAEPIVSGPEAAWDRVLEVLVPWETLRAQPGERMALQAAVLSEGEEIDRVPARVPLRSQVPDEEWEATHWLV
jgi:alpha-amylase/alpha-mannosidase (GH57 family)